MALLRKKNPWHDRFAQPTPADLESLYEDTTATVFDDLCRMIGSRTEAKPSTQWRGIAWRWTLVYTRPGDDEPWAYLIPAPGRPILALPVPANPLPPSELKRTPRFIRDTIVHAPRVGRICWIEFPVDSPSQMADLERFIDRVTEPQPA